MAKPRFRFVDNDTPAIADAQFWRDVEASDRLGSPAKANQYLRELCRSKAWYGSTPDTDHAVCLEVERRLIGEVQARGYRLFGADLEAPTVRFAEAG